MKFNENNKVKSKDLTSKVNRFHKSTIVETKKTIYDVNTLAKRLKAGISSAAKHLLRSHSDSVVDRKQSVAIPVTMVSPIQSPVAMELTNQLQSNESSTQQRPLVSMEKSTTQQPTIASTESSAIMSSPTALANVHWSKEQKPTLRNLDLLKHYLTFISQEINHVDFEDEFIKLSFPKEMNTPNQDLVSTVGASLIEQHVLSSQDRTLSNYHYPDMNNLEESLPKKVGDTNRRRGRPSKSMMIFNPTKMNVKKSKQRMIKKRNEILKKKHVFQRQEDISCICTSPFEEFGTMVQCDDCLNWLHLDCLDLDEKALEETFRCPSCFIKIDRANEDDTKLISGLTWRYAARHKSEEIACYQPLEEDEDEDEFENRITIDHTTSSLGIIMDYDLKYECSDEYSSISFPDDYPSLVFADDATPPSSASPAMSFNDSWSYDLSSGASQYSQPEVSTPQEYLNPTDNWLAPPCAENVFLCQNENKTPAAPFARCSSPPPPTPAEPSIVCAQELPEFNFWEIENSPSVAPMAVLTLVGSDGDIPDFNFWDIHY